VLGGGATLLVRSEIKHEDMWGVLFGVALITIGTSARLGLATLTSSFFLGFALSLLSRHRSELRAMVGPTERPVLLPALLLAGARIDLHANPALPWVAAAAIAARIGAKVLMGWVLAAASPPARKGGPFVGLTLLSSGALSMCIGLTFALRFRGAVGETVLAVASLSAMIGEFVGPVRLRSALRAAGEIEPPSPAAAPGVPA
jgi:Kef-type K+ transport system membrane component KefB